MTLVHIAAVWLLIEKLLIAPLQANLAAFILSFGIGFSGHYFWTFHAPGNPVRAIQRYFITSSAAFTANMLLLSALLENGWLSSSVTAILAAAVIPIINFAVSRLWVFRSAASAARCFNSDSHTHSREL